MDLTPEQTKISANALAAVDDNCLQWVRNVTGNPKAVVAPLAQERVHEIADLVWGLAYRAGREDAAREIEAEAREHADNIDEEGIGWHGGLRLAAAIARGEAISLGRSVQGDGDSPGERIECESCGRTARYCKCEQDEMAEGTDG